MRLSSVATSFTPSITMISLSKAQLRRYILTNLYDEYALVSISFFSSGVTLKVNISVIPNRKYLTAKYLYFALSLIDLQSTGTSQQQITVPDFKKRQILVPSDSAMSDFMEKIDPLFTSIKQNKAEIKTLYILQDYFLTILSH